MVHSAVSDGRSHLYSRARSPSDTLELDDWKCWSRSFPAEPNHFYSPAPRSLRNRNAVLEPSCRRKYQREIGYWLIIAHNSFVNRENRVPHYQRLFQEGARQHVRQWNQVRLFTTPLLLHIMRCNWSCEESKMGCRMEGIQKFH